MSNSSTPTKPTTYKGFRYRVMRSNFGNTVNVVYVFANGQTYDFPTIVRAKRFINIMRGEA